MALPDLLSADTVLGSLSATNRKQALQILSEAAAAKLDLDSRIIFDAVMERERLGSTGVGDGVAIPHARLEGLDHVFGLFAKLKSPIDFDAIDGRPVDLVFLLLAPETSGAEHLKALARISRVFRREDIRSHLRATEARDGMVAILTLQDESDAA
ncbi:PTS IIA-like nitrogen regulatory protein PtsN [Hyphobacterium sp. CCMP332]|uniref:PTS IIA-like nitrogen regulatory protein PtsN n=1 Tax=Hyphobacterium sp. CCMP332 TaxID=2749086 RepID=UPI00164F7C95|nr:PTS IIA-like nitrogen regulatory protein PtsN [Hyphobacterium sp. CCMP332]QNL20089.1 PTS IIA-like nitrogen regulatory protein PtsN [Hyphobacterium sp. CCMP332]